MSEQRWAVKWFNYKRWVLDHNAGGVRVFESEDSAKAWATNPKFFSAGTMAHPVKLKPKAKRERRVFEGVKKVTGGGCVIDCTRSTIGTYALLDGVPDGAQVKVVVTWKASP